VIRGVGTGQSSRNPSQLGIDLAPDCNDGAVQTLATVDATQPQ
jgi:hypothetical protein